ncbi:hypothetical protein F5887DRAFT_1233694 [Amanita rubescens]|nr:hypothetical protein F5887DRAFT_1233694 [Amanita rubescens]
MSLQLDSFDWGNPRSFFEAVAVGGLPMPSSFPTPEEVRKEAFPRSRSIFSDWTFLNHIIERYEATIRKRWSRKTREQRKTILLAAWPNMSPTHRPDFDAFARRKPGRQLMSRDSYMWPYINLEDLVKPKLLLIFLNARGRNPPGAFATADEDSVRFGIVTKNLVPTFLNDYTMMFTGRNTPDVYGELIAWDDEPDAFSWLMARRGMQPGEGLQLLQIQERLYHFLVECCLAILHDIPRESLLQGDIPVQPEPPALSTSEAGLSSLATVATEGPYRLPARLDLVRILEIIAAKRSAAEDHIWSLREDPGYFADVVLAMKEHQLETLPDTRGNRHPSLRPHTEGAFWNKMLGIVVADADVSLAGWDEIHRQITDVQLLMAKYENDILPEKDLPEELLKAFLTLDYTLEQSTKGPIHKLKVSLPASPRVRALFVREPPAPNSSIIRVSRQRPPGDRGQLHLAGLNTLMDEMDRLIQSDLKLKELISPWVANIISDLSVISECRHQISLYQPWAAGFENASAEHEEYLKGNFDDTVKEWTQFHKSFDGTSLGKLGAPLEGRFFYPVEKRRTRETTEAMRRAESNLDEFWAYVDRFLVNKAGMSHHQALRHLLSDDHILRRTPEWVENPEASRQDSQPHNPEDLCQPLSQLYFELEHRTQSTLSPEKESLRKSKVKTRGTAQVVELPANVIPEAMSEIGVEPSFTVDKRAFQIFSTLFYTPSRTSQPGEIAWTDFLHAMGSVGFGIEKLYGSVWQFTPGSLDAGSSIQFHEPHPSGKLPFRTVRRNGRRLFRAYGWHAGMFRLCE